MERKDYHAGIYDLNIYRLADELKIQERKVLDFVSPVNPLGVSKKVRAEIRKHLKYLHNYPDPEARRLRKRLAQCHGVDPETILCGNGSTELMNLVIRALKPGRVFMPALTIAGFGRRCIESSGCRVSAVGLNRTGHFDINAGEIIGALQDFRTRGHGELNASCRASDASGSPGVVFLCNPNDATGRALKKEDVRKIADFAKSLACYLIVDEAFMDFCSDGSVIGDVQANPFLMVLRTMTFFYALAGLRIGYGVFSREVIEKLKCCKEPWTVNSLAQRAAVAALKDKAYKKETNILLRNEKEFLEKSFKKLGMEFIPSDANFYLIKADRDTEIARGLRKRGILVMECTNLLDGGDRNYLRIAVKSHRENALLIKHLAEILRSGE